MVAVTVLSVAGWNPWRALRDRRQTTLVFSPINGADALASIDRSTGDETVILSPALDRTARRAALAHEVIHFERGILPPGTPELVVAREEHQVCEETARRLVPLDDLAEFVARTVEPVTARVVADEFDVPSAVAGRALAQLRHPRSARIRREHGIEEVA